jgi:toxin ParE1/3/4
MVKLIWTEISINDLNQISDFIAADSMRYASITVNKIYNRAQDIVSNPYKGRIVPEFNNKIIREVIMGSDSIVYQIITEKQVVILRVYHSSLLLTQNKLK